MTIIDSDAHVIETTETWSTMTGAEAAFRPQIFRRRADDGAPPRANRKQEYWVIDERPIAKGGNQGDDVPADSRDMVSVKSRLAHMDELGIDLQVLYPTVFLRPMTCEHDVEYALTRSYNRWLADIWKQSEDRLRWAALPPLYSLVDTGKVREELVFAKEHGAVSIFMRGLECERVLSHRYFFPLYEMAQELDLAVTLHTGINSIAIHDAYTQGYEVSLNRFKLPCATAFATLLQDEIPSRFPGVRWAFIEAGALWLPFMLNEAKMRLQRKGRRLADDAMGENRMYVTTQMTDDIRAIVDAVGDDNLLIGTDYGHNDTATDIRAMQRLGREGGIAESTVHKILEANPKRLYGLQ
ncbi:MAG: amidohydrolase family protein [Alphaproteobacteria bacterium]|nr:amidohydrolase family protein [Alphaproteobacteria bacterium]